jgi:serine/threonine protein kinase
MIVVAVQLPVVLGASVVVDLQRLHDSWRELRKVLEAGIKEQTPGGQRAGARPISAGPADVATRGPDSGLITSEVLDEMKRLRGSSGMSPAVLAGVADGTIEFLHTVPDHQLLKNVGRGGYGEVWLARNVLGSYRAAKIVFRKKFKQSEPYEREFAGIKRFEPISRSHPGFVQILHVGRDDAVGYFYYLMEAADDVARGPDIDEATYVPRTLRSAADEHGLLPPADCLRLGIALTGALGYLHDQGLIHRDIKPSNIIFVRGEPKLADIGLVTEIGEDRSLVGTEGYLPPREAFGTPSGDLYSLGMLLYEMSTGQHPRHFPELPNGFNERKPSAALSALNKIVLKACATVPKRGYATANQMQADLAAALAPRRGLFQRRSGTSDVES